MIATSACSRSSTSTEPSVPDALARARSYAPAYAPIARGFNHSLGFLEGGEDHNTSKAFGTHGEVDLSFGAAPAAWPTCEWSELAGVALQSFYDPASTDIDAYAPWPARFDDESGCRALCENRIDCAGYSWRANDTAHQHFHKCFLVSKDGGAHPSAAAFRSATCARPRTNTTWAARGLNGTYTGETFAAEAVRVIEAHDVAVPLFLYLALHNTHAPLEAPWPYVAPFAAQYPDDVKRRATFCGMLAYVDETVANVTAALRRRAGLALVLLARSGARALRGGGVSGSCSAPCSIAMTCSMSTLTWPWMWMCMLMWMLTWRSMSSSTTSMLTSILTCCGACQMSMWTLTSTSASMSRSTSTSTLKLMSTSTLALNHRRRR